MNVKKKRDIYVKMSTLLNITSMIARKTLQIINKRKKTIVGYFHVYLSPSFIWFILTDQRLIFYFHRYRAIDPKINMLIRINPIQSIIEIANIALFEFNFQFLSFLSSLKFIKQFMHKS